MTIDLVEFTSSSINNFISRPVFRYTLGNPFTIALIILVIIMGIFFFYSPDSNVYSFKFMFYIYVVLLILLALHHKIVKKEIKNVFENNVQQNIINNTMTGGSVSIKPRIDHIPGTRNDTTTTTNSGNPQYTNTIPNRVELVGPHLSPFVE